MKTKYLSLLILPMLVACHTYNGIKYELPYNENAALVEVNPKHMLDYAAIEKNDSVYLIAGLNDCSSCVKAKKDVEKYIEKKHVNIFYIDINKVTFSDDYSSTEIDYPDTDYYYLYYATTYYNEGVGDENSLPHPTYINQLALPTLLFFKYGGVGAKVNSDMYHYLCEFIKVNN